jgi:hypothetical protein
MFNTKSDAHRFYIEEKNDITKFFYFKVFSRAHELSKEVDMELLEYKTYLLSTIFGLHLLNPDEIMETPYTLGDVIENTKKLIKDPGIYEDIKIIDEFVSDNISDYILRYLKFNTIYGGEEDILEFTLEIENLSNYVLQDFEFELVWKPKNRIQLVNEEKGMVAQDLHEKQIKHYLFTIHGKGSVIFSCELSFTNPVFQDDFIRTTNRLQKIILT